MVPPTLPLLLYLCWISLSENRAIYEIMWGKYSTAGQAIVDNMAHEHCMLDATNTHSECVMFIAFSKATAVERKVLIVTFIT